MTTGEEKIRVLIAKPGARRPRPRGGPLMPGPDASYPDQLGKPELFPVDETQHAELLGRCLEAFTAADTARKDKEDRWRKFHRVYRSWIERAGAPGWRSAVPIPYVFSVIENRVPRMVSQLPTFLAVPVGPEDVVPAKAMEYKLRYSAERVNLHLELILSIKAALKFGTGILKTFYAQEFGKAYEMVPMMQTVPMTTEEPELGPDGMPVTHMDGNAQMMTRTEEIQEPVMGPDGLPLMIAKPYEFVRYQVMSHRLACDHADLIAGIASLAGVTFLDPASRQPSQPVQVLHIHGTADGSVPYEGGAGIGYPVRALIPGAVRTIHTWAELNGCQGLATEPLPSMDLDLAVSGLHTTVTRYTNCPPGGSVELWTINGGQHAPTLSSQFPEKVVDWLLAHPKP